ncbi:DUF6542 domain-containing protein [Mycolicibacter terrae]|uniref:DUF6542 domain-containing protein n=1 Tax=Mycolicibacter terrae TaxID=1788 RepID=UPI000A14825D|nr:DUF6542 domain-containing protein [Mycolicibacter terrae]ORW88526.1 hypothetical protein AWC28_04755 [Mycolicibacter terrae]
MAAQRDKSAVAPDHRSILPSAAGLPWWAAVAVAVTATAIGVAFDAGSGEKELSTVFSALYVMGCLAAVLMVQQSAVFTAVIQPPLILFCTVPAAYWLFRGAGFPGLKAIVINCGYPLIERFPLMLFTAAAVLLIGMIRWYLGMLGGTATAAADDHATTRRSTLVDKLGSMLTAALNRNPAHAIEPSASRTQRERRSGGRPRRATPEARRAARKATASRSAARSGERRRGANASAPTRSRHVRPPMDDVPVTERPRRRRPAPDLRDEPPTRRRRPAPEWQGEPPRRRGEPAPRTQRDPRARGYRPTEEPESLPRRRPGTTAGRSNGTGTTHHPVSRVRYRNSAGDEPGVEPRTRSRDPRNQEFDSWEYDI